VKNNLIYLFSFFRRRSVMYLVKFIFQISQSNRWLNLFDPNTIRRVRNINYPRMLERISYKGCFLTVDINDHIGFVSFLRSRPFELAVLDVSKHIGLRESDTILDVGANIGSASVPAAVTTGCEILVIEPSSENLQLLLENIKQNDVRALVFKFAITSEKFSNRYLQLFDRSGNSGAKSLNSDWNVGVTESEESEYVPTRTIDQLYRANEQFANIKLVKIDVEGLEYDVISGAAEFLNNVRPYIIMEYRIDITHEAKQNLQRCVEELSEIYSVNVINEDGILTTFDFNESYENILLSPVESNSNDR